MQSPPHILSISYDRALLATRQMVLESRGYKVTSVEEFEKAAAVCRSLDYDLLIIGHSVPTADKYALIDAAKQHGRHLILTLIRPGEMAIENASKSIDASYSPDMLLSVVDELLAH